MQTTAPTVKRIILHLAVFVSIISPICAKDFFIHDGDRVLFLGDSITQQAFYTNYIEAYTLSRHPSWKLTFRNAGWGGDTSWLRQRWHTDESLLFASDDAAQLQMIDAAIGFGLGRDVLPFKPTVVTVNFGMNDHGYQAFRPDILRAYIRSQTQISRVLSRNGIRPVFLTTQPIEEKRADPNQDVKNISLKDFAEALREMASQEHVEFADQFDPYMQAMLASLSSAIGGGGDSVHPGPPGHTIMAWAVLKALGASSLVSTVAIDSQAMKVDAVQGSQVGNLKTDGGVISFDRLDAALPMPVDHKAESALAIVPITRDLNDYELTITGLPPGNYTVSIDGEVAASVSANDLAHGWNLAYLAGPVTRQSQDLLSLVQKKNDLYFKRWREVQLYSAPDWVSKDSDLESRRKSEMAKLDGEISALETRIDAERQPRSRHFVVAPEKRDAQ